jgi:SAM-dependent methyltransferase
MSVRSRIRRALAVLVGPADLPGAAVPATTSDTTALANLRHELDYLQLEVSRLRSLVRYMTAGTIHEMPLQMQTRESFDFQWSSMPDGNWIETRPELKEREPKLVVEYTQLPRSWFNGKRVLDAGCGSGRFSWAFASMGATVFAVDQSPAGVMHTQRACAEFGNRVTVQRHDLTAPLDLAPSFDLVWSFGVLHHTGDTYGAFRNIARLVAPGGYLFLMLYGEPTGDDPGAFAYYAEVERLRRATAAMTLQERHAEIERLKGRDVGGWFDAVSPVINDTYSFHEIQLWLRREGFVDIKRTVDHASHHVMARRPGPA